MCADRQAIIRIDRMMKMNWASIRKWLGAVVRFGTPALYVGWNLFSAVHELSSFHYDGAGPKLDQVITESIVFGLLCTAGVAVCAHVVACLIEGSPGKPTEGEPEPGSTRLP
jgi:hypothetical protein